MSRLPWGHNLELASVGVARYTTGSDELLERAPQELQAHLPELERISAGVQQIVERHSGEIQVRDRCGPRACPHR